MPTPKNSTNRNQIKPLGVAVKRRGNRPTSTGAFNERADYGPRPVPYQHGKTGEQPRKGTDTYLLDGLGHLFDGKCHPACPNVT